MAFTARPRQEIRNCVQQRGQRLPVTAEPGEQRHAEQQENGSRGSQPLWAATNHSDSFHADSSAWKTSAAAASAKK